MQMTLVDYINSYYDVRDKIRDKIKDPITRIMEEDALPCDGVKMVDGEYQKVVYVDDEDGEFIPVLSLLGETEESIKKITDPIFVEIWHAYMSNIKLEDFDIKDIINSAIIFKQKHDLKEKRLKACIE